MNSSIVRSNCVKAFIFLSGCALMNLMSCQAAPNYDCYYGYVFTGTIKDGLSNPIEGVQVIMLRVPKTLTTLK